MEKREFLFDGKAKQIYATDDPNYVVILFKDDTTAYNGIKRAFIRNKGVLNNRISEIIFQQLEKNGIKTHFIKRLDTHNQLCKKLDIIPLEFIVRNVVAGSLARRLDMEEGVVLKNTVYELCYKKSELHDPIVNESLATALGLITEEELERAWSMAKKINRSLIDMFDKAGIDVIDFKIEFGRDKDGQIILVDEISPDSARFWDKKTKKKLDKDRFRRELGQIEESYRELLERLEAVI